MTKLHHPLNVAGEPRAFFGRRSGKRLHKGQDALFREVLPGLEITLGEGPLDPRAAVSGSAAASCSRSAMAAASTWRGRRGSIPRPASSAARCFPAASPSWCSRSTSRGSSNVRLFTDDALKLLVKLPDASLDEAYLLYPDPWPKTRHHKRRFVSPTTLARAGAGAQARRAASTSPPTSRTTPTGRWRTSLRSPDFGFAPAAPGDLARALSGLGADALRRKGAARGPRHQFLFHLHAALGAAANSVPLRRRRLVADDLFDPGHHLGRELALVVERLEVVLELAELGGAEDHRRDVAGWRGTRAAPGGGSAGRPRRRAWRAS